MAQKETYKILPIGIIRTPFKEHAGTPVQPAYGEGVEGVVEIFPEYREGLADVGGFERIWLIFWFDRSQSYKLKLVPYRDVVERGLFATRAPSRPNPIGISAVRVLEVDIERGLIKISDIDMLDGTPLLDIKPYSPKFDSHPQAKSGWLDKNSNNREKADGRFSNE